MDTERERDPLGALLERARKTHAQHGGEFLAVLTSVLDYFDSRTNQREPAFASTSAGNRAFLAAIAAMSMFRLESAGPEAAVQGLHEALAMMRKIAHHEFVLARDLETGRPVDYTEPAERVELKAGRHLGPYVIEEFIASGTTSEVYLAFNRYSLLPNRRVALKVLKKPSDWDNDKQKNEAVAEIWANLTNPHVVRLEDVCQVDGYVFYVTERIKGKSLQSVFEGYTIQERIAAMPQVLLTVCEALGVANASVKARSILDGRMPLHVRHADKLMQLGELIQQLMPAEKDTPPELKEISEWVRHLLQQCIPNGDGRARPSLDWARAFIRFHTSPEDAGRVRIVAHQSRKGVDYHVEYDGKIEKQILHAPTATPGVTDDIALRWRQIGEYIRQHKHGRALEELDVIRESYRLMFPGELVRILAERDLSTVTLVHDRALNGIPWEALQIGREELSIRFALSRMPQQQNAVLCARSRRGPMKATLIHDVLLPACREEAKGLESLFRSHGLDVQVLATNAGSSTLKLHVGSCDILHFAGHGIFVPPGCDFSEAGLHFTSEDTLVARELKELWREGAPTLVFANACYTGANDVRYGRESFHPDVCVGFAQEALAAGATNFVGTALPIKDGDAFKFAEKFYQHWLAGRVISQAMWEARRAFCGLDGSLLSLQHALLGDPFTRAGHSGAARAATA